MQRCKTLSYCFAKFAKPLSVSCSMMFMLPIRGRPFGPGGYGTIFLQIRGTMRQWIVNQRVSRNSFSVVFSSKSKFIVVFYFLFFGSLAGI